MTMPPALQYGVDAAAAAADVVINEAWEFFNEVEAKAAVAVTADRIKHSIGLTGQVTRGRPSNNLKGFYDVIDHGSTTASSLINAASEYDKVRVSHFPPESLGEDNWNKEVESIIEKSPGCYFVANLPVGAWKDSHWKRILRAGPKQLSRLQLRQKRASQLLERFA